MPSKEFDERFQEITKEMLEIAYEFNGSNDQEIDIIFLLGSTEDEGFETNFFYRIGNAIVPKQAINEHLKAKADISKERQFEALRLENELLTKMAGEFKNDGREVPTLIKIIYSPRIGKFDCKLNYEPFFGDGDIGSFYDLYSEWIKEEETKLI